MQPLLFSVNNKGKIRKKQGASYTPRSKKNLETALNMLELKIPKSKLKSIPLPDQKVRGETIKRKISIRKGRPPKIIRNGKSKAFFDIDAKEMLGDYQSYLNDLMKHHNYDFYSFAVYGNQVQETYIDSDMLAEEYENIRDKYLDKNGETKVNGVMAWNAIK